MTQTMTPTGVARALVEGLTATYAADTPRDRAEEIGNTLDEIAMTLEYQVAESDDLTQAERRRKRRYASFLRSLCSELDGLVDVAMSPSTTPLHDFAVGDIARVKQDSVTHADYVGHSFVVVELQRRCVVCPEGLAWTASNLDNVTKDHTAALASLFADYVEEASNQDGDEALLGESEAVIRDFALYVADALEVEMDERDVKVVEHELDARCADGDPDEAVEDLLAELRELRRPRVMLAFLGDPELSQVEEVARAWAAQVAAGRRERDAK